jgi:hypothetical protein
MQNVGTYQSEIRTLKALNGRLHADIWRLGRVGNDACSYTAIQAIRKETDANERRMHTIDYLIGWLHDNGKGTAKHE